MSKETGGKAFPEIGNVANNSDWQSESGMTLRDYLAANAMNGLASNPSMIDAVHSSSADWLARNAYEIADAMLSARASNS